MVEKPTEQYEEKTKGSYKVSENLSREEMLAYLVAFGKCASEYYTQLNDDRLKQEYEDTRNA